MKALSPAGDASDTSSCCHCYLLLYTARMKDVRSNNNVVYICRYHVVFCPKYRRKALTPPIDERLKVMLAE